MGPSPPEEDFAKLGAKWRIYRPDELAERCEKEGPEKYLIEGLIHERCLALIAGDSGLGKSPLSYQMAICVAAGVPFLGHAVRKSRVLYMDFENGYRDVQDLIVSLSAHL